MHMCHGQRSQVCWPVAGSHLEYTNEDHVTMATVIQGDLNLKCIYTAMSSSGD